MSWNIIKTLQNKCF